MLALQVSDPGPIGNRMFPIVVSYLGEDNTEAIVTAITTHNESTVEVWEYHNRWVT
jgi:hypothetical protein